MSRLEINTGSSPNDGLGDSLLDGANKINGNFYEIYSSIGDGNNITIGIGKSIISTDLSGNVGIGTTNPTDKLTIIGGNLSVGINTDHGLILTSPNGTRYRIFISDSGMLETTSVD